MPSPAETSAQAAIAASILIIQTSLATLISDFTLPVTGIIPSTATTYLKVLAPNNIYEGVDISKAITNLVSDTTDTNFPAGQLTLPELSVMVQQLADNVKSLSDYINNSTSGLMKVYQDLVILLNNVNALCISVSATGAASALANPSPA